ncbi:hypothetical protein HUT19_36490 [Streptomyces sp. NA02950]|uniref:hypothetical protein n=1 Tax=Streptomyces sp. NA02950 TaxID=2742137 RepID=UPI0015912C6F|nr:hypothetical protein [Streptomyces sp. NA02950]QKV96519.1 hypothetical protein HUT19_36490 [Streptomyces sp. NA02950]
MTHHTTSHTTSRATFRRTLAALAALPVLALAVGCGGGGESATRDEGVASVPGEDTGGSGGSSKDAGGGTGKSGTGKGKSAYYDAQMDYVRCMRGKAGVKDFPDPKLSGYLDWTKIERLDDPTGTGEVTKGGKDGVCNAEMQKAMRLEPERDAQKEYESMLAHAKCMRDEGVSGFQNPTMSAGNAVPGGDLDPANPRIDTDSPVYKQAREACKDKLLDGLDGMQ